MSYHTKTLLKTAGHESSHFLSLIKNPIAGSANKRIIPWEYRFIGMAMNIMSLVSVDWAARQLGRLWFSVFKNTPKSWVKKFWMMADRRYEVTLNDQEIAVYSWGQGPLVVLMHGWSGSGTQFRYFIPALVQAGYRVAAFDAPGHGSNPGRYSDLLQFSDSLVAIQQQLGPINTVIAHSLGAMATTLATHRGLMPGRIVLIAPHLDIDEMFNSYADLLNLRAILKQRFRENVKQKIDQLIKIEDSWRLFNINYLLDDNQQSGLLVFDEDDNEVPQKHFREIENHWINAQTVHTRGLGHVQVLKDQNTIASIIDYLRKQ